MKGEMNWNNIELLILTLATPFSTLILNNIPSLPIVPAHPVLHLEEEEKLKEPVQNVP